MKSVIALCLMVSLVLPATALAGLGSKKAAYQGGTTKDRDFPGAGKAVEGYLDTADEEVLKFEYVINGGRRIYQIPYRHFVDIEYGQKAGRRVGASIATAILISPVGLFMLFSKKRKHFVTIGYTDDLGKEQVAVFELGKDVVRTTLPILEARSGKRIMYQDEEAKKSGLGSGR
ncbi:MAG: hypothetical protein GXY47_04040 [Acidobacteria bacterium]|nr:hypothetical protein [Acidobacteriota bacterium]